jgi:hypothetical protein
MRSRVAGGVARTVRVGAQSAVWGAAGEGAGAEWRVEAESAGVGGRGGGVFGFGERAVGVGWVVMMTIMTDESDDR